MQYITTWCICSVRIRSVDEGTRDVCLVSATCIHSCGAAATHHSRVYLLCDNRLGFGNDRRRETQIILIIVEREPLRTDLYRPLYLPHALFWKPLAMRAYVYMIRQQALAAAMVHVNRFVPLTFCRRFPLARSAQEQLTVPRSGSHITACAPSVANQS